MAGTDITKESQALKEIADSFNDLMQVLGNKKSKSKKDRKHLKKITELQNSIKQISEHPSADYKTKLTAITNTLLAAHNTEMNKAKESDYAKKLNAVLENISNLSKPAPTTPEPATQKHLKDTRLNEISPKVPKRKPDNKVNRRLADTLHATALAPKVETTKIKRVKLEPRDFAQATLLSHPTEKLKPTELASAKMKFQSANVNVPAEIASAKANVQTVKLEPTELASAKMKSQSTNEIAFAKAKVQTVKLEPTELAKAKFNTSTSKMSAVLDADLKNQTLIRADSKKVEANPLHEQLDKNILALTTKSEAADVARYALKATLKGKDGIEATTYLSAKHPDGLSAGSWAEIAKISLAHAEIVLKDPAIREKLTAGGDSGWLRNIGESNWKIADSILKYDDNQNKKLLSPDDKKYLEAIVRIDQETEKSFSPNKPKR